MVNRLNRIVSSITSLLLLEYKQHCCRHYSLLQRGRQGAAYGGENDQDGAYSGHQVNYCNNYYKPGPATKRAITNPESYRFMSPSHATMVAEWHFSGNYMEGNATITADNNKGVVNENPTLIKLLDHWLVPEVFYPGYRFDYEKYTYKDKMQTAEEAYQEIGRASCRERV